MIPKEKWKIVREGIKNANVSERCRRYGVPHKLVLTNKDRA
jgi:hypothetical protein